MTRKLRRPRPIGELSEHKVYTGYRLRRAFGIGEQTLCEMIDSGIVRPIEVSQRMAFDGAELIAWLRTRAPRKARKRRATA